MTFAEFIFADDQYLFIFAKFIFADLGEIRTAQISSFKVIRNASLVTRTHISINVAV